MKIILLFIIICFPLEIRGIFATELVGYEAYYTMDIVKPLNTGNQLSDFRGMLVINREKTCDGWTSTENLKMQVKFKSGRTILRDLQYSGWESARRTFYRFGTQENSPLRNFNVRGSANLYNGEGQINFKIPEEKIITLPLNTKFPVGFTKWLIEKIKSGKTEINTYFFDGTDAEGPELVKAVIDGKAESNLSGNLKDKILLKSQGWNIKFFVKPYKENTEQLSYSYDAVILENGVLLSTKFDFEGLKVLQEIRTLNEFSDPEC